MRLRPGRVVEIAEPLLCHGADYMFPCHKTTDMDALENGTTPHGEIHCAGALIFAEKHNAQTKYMQIAERLGFYEPRKLMENHRLVDQVFDSVGDMVGEISE
jgi:hypothetical protein